MNVVQRLLISFVLVAVSSSVLAQEPAKPGEELAKPVITDPKSPSAFSSGAGQGAIDPYVEYRKRVDAAQNVSP
ncbi:MAG: hypothetical protein SH820_06695 [Xanthomonadales bacterium]|nr:hypothetical protein [Xanthomonadales bacterium]